MNRKEMEMVSREEYVNQYLKLYLKAYAYRLADAYTETKKLIDPNYKFYVDTSPHKMFISIPHKDLKEELELFINIYLIDYKTCMHFMWQHVVDRMSFFQKCKFFFHGGGLGIHNWCPKEFPGTDYF